MTKPLAAFALGLMLFVGAQFVAASPAAAGPAVAGLDGDWEGTLDAGAAGKLRLILHVRTDADGTTASLDSLDQNADGIPVSGISRDGDKVHLEVIAVQGDYEGTLGSGGRVLTGRWSQLGQELPLTLTRRDGGELAR